MNGASFAVYTSGKVDIIGRRTREEWEQELRDDGSEDEDLPVAFGEVDGRSLDGLVTIICDNQDLCDQLENLAAAILQTGIELGRKQLKEEIQTKIFG